MMNRGCPATGRMMHRFDPATHRCKCGRWERGYKPKVDPVRPRAECQICERTQALDGRGCLGHHGYTRPGCGWIQGDCMGVAHDPYPATEALESYLEYLGRHIRAVEARLAGLWQINEIEYRHGTRRDPKVTTVRRGEESRCVWPGGVYVPSFDDLERRERARLESELRAAGAERERVERRIEKAHQLKGGAS